jgi:hypothetical protein
MAGAMSKMLFVMVTAAAMALSGTFALGAEPKPAPDVQSRAEEALKEGAERIMRALELMLHAVPQYEMPEVLDNGDIIIRRRNPDVPRRKSPPKGTDETAT